MRRIAATAALAAVTLLALPSASAGNCRGDREPELTAASTRVVACSPLRVSGGVELDGNGFLPPCMPGVLPRPEPSSADPEEHTETVEVTAEPSPLVPLVTLPPLVPVAYAPRHVTVTIGEPIPLIGPDPEARPIATLPAEPRLRLSEGWYRFAFDGRVTIPRDVKPGRYVLRAHTQPAPYYGQVEVTVVEPLAATGGHAADLVRLGLLSLATGAAALVAGRRRSVSRTAAG